MPIERNGVKVKLLYKQEDGVSTEIKLLKDNAGNIIHKRSNITYVTENNALISSEIKTWGAEELNPPTPPTKEYHNFTHWESDVEGIIGTNTLAPKTDAVYKPKYEVAFPGEVMTEQFNSSGANVNYGWGNLPIGNNSVVFSTEGFESSVVWNPTSKTNVWRYHQLVMSSSAKFGVDVHLEIEFTMGDGPFPQMIYKGDVPAGTDVNITGSANDGAFNVSVVGSQVDFSHTHSFEGMIEVRVTKV